MLGRVCMRVRAADLRNPPKCGRRILERGLGDMAKTLYVGNLPWTATEEDLTRLFTPYASVLAARVATERGTGRSRGFGFVEVPDEQAKAAIEGVHGISLEGRSLTVNEARAREERARQGGSRRY